MNDQDFFKLLIGDPPPEVEFEIASTEEKELYAVNSEIALSS